MSVSQETLENSPLINWTILQELLLMDEDEEGFTLSLVQTFVEQAKEIFQDMDNLIINEDKSDDKLKELSNFGHYLKGSAAALGLIKIQEQCERIQNYGQKYNFDNFELANNAKENKDWFNCSKDALELAKNYYKETIQLLSSYFNTQL